MVWDEIDQHKMDEAAAIGSALIQTIADNIGIEPDPEKIDRAVYDGTDCGAWVEFDELGILVGTIVEGSDATYSERIELCEDEKELCERFWAAIQRCEDFADEHFNQEEDEDEFD